ncbi:MAG: RHS repeat-associated core domain-containing protein, partial [Anaerolineae bacterium]
VLDNVAGGLYFYNARYYDPTLARFISADTLIPQPQNPQNLNRYSYVGNRPLRFTDPTGHCIDGISTIACVAVAGFIAGGVVDLGKQLIVDRKDIRDVNWAEVGGAAVGGLVAGATLGLAPAGASLLGVAAFGGVGSAAGGQVQALTQAGIEQLMGKNPQKSVMEQARQLGLFDTGAIAADMTAGVVMGGLGGKFAGWLRAKLPLPGSASAITLRSDMPMARWQLRLDQPGIWTVKMEGRVLNIDADVFEKIVRSIAIGGYDAAEQILQEAIQQGLVDVVEETAQP